MTSDLAAAVRRATELTRGFSLTEATRVIQSALAGRQPATEPGTPSDSHLLLEPAHVAETETSKPKTLGDRILRPLGEVVQTLKEGRATVLDAPRARHPKAPVPAGAQFVARTFTCNAGSRQYKLFVPATGAEPPRGLIVMLHGCQQNPDDFATGTKMNEIAAANNLVVAYPSQTSSANVGGCWNWFAPAHQMRDRGEPAILAGITQHLMQEFGLKRQQVVVAGLSAGGAMAAVLIETYPELYAGAGIHSGLAYRSANDVMSAFAVMNGDTGNVVARKSRSQQGQGVRAIIFQGSADTTVHPSNARRLVTALVDSGAVAAKHRGQANGQHFTRETFASAPNADPSVEFWSIDGAGHAWSGGNEKGSFADAAGPDASAELVRFFFQR